MSDNKKVRIRITGRWELVETVSLTPEQYEEFSSRFENARDRDAAQDLMDAARVTLRDSDIDDLRIDEFEEVP